MKLNWGLYSEGIEEVGIDIGMIGPFIPLVPVVDGG